MATTNKSLNQPAYDSPNWDVPLNANFGFIDSALGSTTAISVAGVPAAPVVLTSTQYVAASLSFTGLLGNNVTYQVPSGVGGSWAVFNGTTGAFTLTIDNVAVGTSVVVPQGQSRIVFSDGTNIKFSNNYGTSGQVLFNDASGTTGDSDFTFASDILTVPRVRLGDGTALLPALANTTSNDTGVWFPANNEIAISTDGSKRLAINVSGAIALGASTDYGTSGMALKTLGSGAQAAWGYAGAVAIANQAASGTSVTFSGLTLTSYKFVTIVLSAVQNGAAGTRDITLDGVVIKSVGAGVSVFGMASIHLLSGVGTSDVGGAAGGASESHGFGTSITTGSTSITVALSAGSFSGGNIYLLGVA